MARECAQRRRGCVTANERRPAGAASEAWRPEPIVLGDALDEWIDWYQSGVEHGIAIGRQQVEDEWRGRQAVSAAIARQIASWGPYDELADRRGDHGRAQAQRRILAERGIR